MAWGDEGLQCIVNILISNKYPNLVKLGINTNNVSDCGVQAIADTLDARKNPNCRLQVLGLSENYSITHKGALAVANALHFNTTLVRLFFNKDKHLSPNMISNTF